MGSGGTGGRGRGCWMIMGEWAAKGFPLIRMGSFSLGGTLWCLGVGGVHCGMEIKR